MSDAKKLFQERIQLFKDAAKHKKTHRVLNLANIWTWKIYDAGYTIDEATKDYNKMEDVIRKFQEKYQFDLQYEAALGLRNPLRLADAFGKTDYFINNETYAMNFPDVCYMHPDEYDDVIEDYNKYRWTKLMPRKFKKLNGSDAKEILKNASLELIKLGQYTEHVNQVLAEEYGVPPLAKMSTFFIPFYEVLFNALRGVKGISVDIRRQPEKVKAACDAVSLGKSFEKYKATTQKGTDMNVAADIFTVFLGHSLLSPKQFEIYYWPYLKEMFDFVEKYDKILHIFAEHHNVRFYDFFKEAPKGHVVMQLEMDDIFKAKKEIGDKICLEGGMPIDLLYYGTKEENIAYAKRLIDELAADGGFIFSQNKMVSFVNDCKAENLKAVNDFVREYTL